MWSGIRTWLKVVIGFLYSITTILSSLTYALFGAKEKDMVEIIVTEATGIGNRVVIFSGRFEPMIIHNVFWLSLAAVGFFLIFLYFIDHSFRVFLGPGVLSMAIFIFLNLILWLTRGTLLAYAGGYAAVFVLESLAKIRQASFAVFALGLFLIGLSYWGSRRKANSLEQPND
jgi:hypothetical protein